MFNQSISIKPTLVNSYLGLFIASIIIFSWFISFVTFLSLDLSQTPLILIIMGVFLRAFLHTGLFIIIHESIHGVICQQPKVNDFLGYFTSLLYAILPYETLAESHRLHHRYPATEKDPDFYPQNPHNFLLWYITFMKRYQKGKQFWILFTGMSVVFYSLIGFHVPLSNILLFWLIPLLLSSLQLFTFGIFLPHRPIGEDYDDNTHRARSTNYSVFWSFITCYHFGYHLEHHERPDLPWYKLPSVRPN